VFTLYGNPGYRKIAMTDEPDNLILRYLRRIDASAERLSADMGDVKQRLTSVERQIGELRVDMAGISARMDRSDLRLERIERRLDIVEAN
jgi:septal ring factor EnvC (AmiA/AmiB activator)